MPRPSTSIFRMPSASRSSLSHSTKVRSGIAPLPIGITSSSRLRVMTKPPTCCDRWRGKAVDLVGERGDLLHARAVESSPAAGDRVLRHCAAAGAPDRGRQRADSVFGQPKYLADLADGRAAAIADHGGGDAGALAAVFLVDVLDDLFAPLVLEIDVDVGRLVALGRNEALEQQVVAVGIDFGDAEAEAHGGVGGGTAALAQNILRTGVAHDVVDGEEIGRIFAPQRSA